ncbi:MAG: hypothetical protein KatS3mg061_2226 [Dehalococcoidia bacterium]|nr:MAG: hypothetical protein KatS3mg061_2226 [Dehalococcoidia bacterium]
MTTVATLEEQAGVTLDEPLTVVAYRTTADLDSAYPPRRSVYPRHASGR